MTIQLTKDEIDTAVREWFKRNHPTLSISADITFTLEDEPFDDFDVVARFEVIIEDKPAA